MVLIGQWKSVEPSGALRATSAAPITPFTPVRFSTTTRAPSSGPNASAIRRVTKSEAPPAAAPLTGAWSAPAPCRAAQGRAQQQSQHDAPHPASRSFLWRFSRRPGPDASALDVGVAAGFDQRMTFSLIARCPRTGQIGAAVTTSSIAVATRVPFCAAGIGAVLTQHRTDPRLGPRGLKLLRSGCSAAETVAALVASTRMRPGGSWPSSTPQAAPPITTAPW